jgi:acetyl esterase/lipase
MLAAPALADEPRVVRDIAYTEPKNASQTLDLYAPQDGKNHPVAFWIHGGGWQHGDKSEADSKPQAFVDRGYVFVSTNYRFVPGATAQEIAFDVAKAIRWVHDHARDYGGNPDRILVIGHSAGAQLAALVCTDGRYLRAEKLSASIVRACVPVDGDTYDIPLQIATVEQKRKDFYRMAFGDEPSQEVLSSVTHAPKGQGIPPFLILHVAGHPETTAQAHRLADALQQGKVSVKVYPAADTDHVRLNADLGKPDDEPTRVLFEFLGGVLANDPD